MVIIIIGILDMATEIIEAEVDFQAIGAEDLEDVLGEVVTEIIEIEGKDTFIFSFILLFLFHYPLLLHYYFKTN